MESSTDVQGYGGTGFGFGDVGFTIERPRSGPFFPELPIVLSRMSGLYRRTITRSLEGTGMGYNHGMVLMALRLFGGMRLTEIGSVLGMDAGNANRIVRDLRSAGLVTDDRRCVNGRGFTVHITDEGLQMADVIDYDLRCLGRSMSEGIPRFSSENMAMTLGLMLRNSESRKDVVERCATDATFKTYARYSFY